MIENKRFSAVWGQGKFPDPKSAIVGDIVEDVWLTYVEEVSSMLFELEEAALSLESGENLKEDAAKIRRILHSIKGDSGISGVNDVHDLCHETESALEQLFEKGSATDVLLRVKDWIDAAVKHINSDSLTTQKESELHQNKNKPKLKALIIDDDIVCRERLKMLLDDFFDCTFAVNGFEGFELYKKSVDQKEHFKLVTLDINMPQMDGHETLKAIREFEYENDIKGLDGVKVVMTTSEGGSNHVISAFNQGCEAYVTKTKMGDKLLDEIAKLGLLRLVKVEKDYVIEI